MRRYWPMAVVLLFLAGWFGMDLLMTDEDRVRAVIEDLRDEFNNTSARGIVDNLSDDYLDEPSGADKVTLRAAFARSFLEHRTRGGPYPYRVEIDGDSLQPEISADRDSAEVGVALTFYDQTDSPETVEWRLHVSAHLERESGNRWHIVRTEWRTIEGRHPF